MSTHPKKKIFAISGSTRANSTNLQIIKAVAAMASDIFEIEIHEKIASLPHFNPDLEKDNIPEVVAFREKIALADGVLICTPEYVFSLPGSLKNALEWTVSTIVFSDKPVALITASSSGKIAHESLALVMQTIGGVFDEDASLLISHVKTKVNQAGEITDSITSDGLKKLIRSFEKAILDAEATREL